MNDAPRDPTDEPEPVLDTSAEEALATLTRFEATPVTDADVLAIKVHAFNEHPYPTRYLGMNEYTDVLQALKTVAVFVERIDRPFASAFFVFRLPDGEHFLFIEHETGPKILILVDAASHVLQHATMTVGSFGGFILAVNRVVTTLRKSIANQRTLSSELPQREAVSVARRALKGVRRVKVLPVTPDPEGQAIISLDELV